MKTIHRKYFAGICYKYINQYTGNMNLYIFHETDRAAMFGIGTYIHELTNTLNICNIDICVVSIRSNRNQIITEKTDDGIKRWYFPAPIQEQRTTERDQQNNLYHKNIVSLLRLRIEDKRDLVFHLNYCQCVKMAEELKNAFVCRVVSVVHFTGWGFTIYDNPPRLRSILDDERLDSLGENVRKSVKQEKELCARVDRII